MRRLLLVLALVLVMSVVAAPGVLAKGGGTFCFPYDAGRGPENPAYSCGNKSMKECEDARADFAESEESWRLLGDGCINIKRT